MTEYYAGPLLEALIKKLEGDIAMAKANVEEAMKRLPIIAPIPTTKTLVTQTQGGGNDAQQLQSVQKGVIHLVESALNPKNLARMEVSWQSWL